MYKFFEKYSRYFWYSGFKTCYIRFAKLKFKCVVQVHFSFTRKVSLCYASDCRALLLPLPNSKKKRPRSTAPASHRRQCIPFEDSVLGKILTVFWFLKIANLSCYISADKVICDLTVHAVCRRAVPLRICFDHTPVHFGFLMHKVQGDRFFFEIFRFSSIISIPSMPNSQYVFTLQRKL
jgi:hypothetical protein